MKKESLRHMAGLLDDLSFFYRVTGDEPRSKSLKKAARKAKKATKKSK